MGTGNASKRVGLGAYHAALVSAVVAMLCLPARARAYSGGVTTANFGASGCNQCHSGGNAPDVTLSGPTTVAPSSTNEYVLSIAQTGSQKRGGLNVSCASGVLAKGGSAATLTQKRIVNGRAEITHSDPKSAMNGFITFSFLWTAPDAPATAVLSAWGNAVNGNGTNFGDAASRATITVVVADVSPTPTYTPPTPPTPSATASATPPSPPTVTGTASATQTPLSTETSTVTATATATPTPSSTVTATPSVPASATGIPTATAPSTSSPSSTAISSATATAPRTFTSTSIPTASVRTPTATVTFAGTPTPRDTTTPTATHGASATPSSTPSPLSNACDGDCDHNGSVSVDELVRAVNIALGGAVASCPAADADGDGFVTVAELVKAVNAALSGC